MRDHEDAWAEYGYDTAPKEVRVYFKLGFIAAAEAARITSIDEWLAQVPKGYAIIEDAPLTKSKTYIVRKVESGVSQSESDTDAH